MGTINKIRLPLEDSWFATLACLLPLWLLSLSITVEGFPNPPISGELAVAAFWLAIATSIILLWRRWLEVDLLLYTFLPFALLVMFDEISTAYKSPFILICAFILSVGIVAAKHSSVLAQRWMLLLLTAVATWMLASHAARDYWDMVGNLVFGDCFPYTKGCPPLAGTETPWWVLFFGL